MAHLLTTFCALNAFYTFWRKRHYRLFEASIDKPPTTPSAQRVRVDSSPLSSASPLRFISSIVSANSVESRAHPNAERDVWQLAVWDPLPLALRIFCMFSPGHVLVYWLFLPTSPSDPRPSVTIVTTIFLASLLSVQLSMLSSSFSQQAKDSALVHKEVLNEYDTKFVHPRTQPLMRDVATQYTEPPAHHAHFDEKYNHVQTFTPTHVINRGFKTSPNPNYIHHVDPEGLSERPSKSDRRLSTPSTISSIQRQHPHIQTPNHLRDSSSPIRSSPIRGPSTGIRQPQFRPTPSTTGDGGNLGVYSHAQSPLRKSASSNFDIRNQRNGGDIEYRDSMPSPAGRPTSPLKRTSVPSEISTAAAAHRWGHLTAKGRRGSGLL